MNERIEFIYGIKCAVRTEKFTDGKKRDVYTFTVPGWKECTVTGKQATKRVINGRTCPYVLNTLGLND